MAKKISHVDNSRTFRRVSRTASTSNLGFSKTGDATRKNNSMKKMAEARVVRVAPRVYSPLFEISNLMLPRDQKTLNAWSRHFYEVMPWIRNTINLHATYPISKFDIRCDDPKVEKFFSEMCEDINLYETLVAMSLEYWKLGECQKAGTLITMADGSVKPIEKVKRGDKVLTHTGQKKQVTDLTCRPLKENEKVYSIKFVGSNEPLVCTGNHPIFSEKFENIKCKVSGWAKNGQKCWPSSSCSSTQTKKGKVYPGCRKPVEWNLNFHKAESLAEGDIVVLPINRDVDKSLPKELTKNWCRLFGYFLGEGCYLKNEQEDYRGVAITNSDPTIIDEVTSLCRKMSLRYNIGTQKVENISIIHVNVTDRDLAIQFLYHGGEYSKDKKLSEKIMLLPIDYQKEILSAFINGDGSIDKTTGSLELSTNSRNLINQFILMLGRANIGATLTSGMVKYAGKKKYKVKNRNYKIKIKAFDTPYFADSILPEKVALLKSIKKRQNFGVFRSNYYLRSIQKITEVPYNDYVYNLEVEDDHSYVAQGVAVHNCFPYAELDENTGKWSTIIVHNPDYIDLRANVLAKEPVISLQPDDTLRRLVMSSRVEDLQLRKQLPDEVIYYIQRGENIPLDNFNVSHLKLMSSPYDIRGTSIIVSCFKDLMLYDKLREAKYAQADDLVNPITLVKLGDPNGVWRPTDDDISAFQTIMEEAQYDPDFKIITHGAVTIERIGAAGTVLEMNPDIDRIEKNVFTGLLVPFAVVTAEGPTYSTASVGLQVLQDRYIRFRNLIERWVKKKLFEPISKINKFYKIEGGEKKLIVPDVVWEKMDLRNTSDYISTIVGLLGEHVSTQTLFRILDIDYKEEVKHFRAETVSKVIREKEEEIMRRMSLEELRALDPDKPLVSPTEKPLAGEVPEEKPEEKKEEKPEIELPKAPPTPTPAPEKKPEEKPEEKPPAAPETPEVPPPPGAPG